MFSLVSEHKVPNFLVATLYYSILPCSYWKLPIKEMKSWKYEHTGKVVKINIEVLSMLEN